jgi:Tfp pilus assembly protein PilF
MKAIALRSQAAVGLALLLAAVSVGCVTVPVETVDVGRKAETRRDVGIDHLARGRPAMAIRDLLEAESLDPSDYETQLWLGEAYRRRDMLDKAEEHLLRSVELAPHRHRPLMNVAALYIQMGRFEESIRYSEKLIEDPTFPTPWQALTNKGWALFQLDKRTEARAILERALEFDPDFWPTLLDLGILENAEGRRLQALEYFQQVLAKDPGPGVEAEVNYRMGEVFVAMGRADKAVSHFANAIETSPKGRWGRESQRYLKLLR